MLSPSSTLVKVPPEIMILIFRHLNPTALLHLSLTSRFLHSLINEWGWQSALRYQHHPSVVELSNASLKSALWINNPKSTLRYIHLTERGWNNRGFIARPLNNPWPAKFHPVVNLDAKASLFVIAAGTSVYSYRLTSGGPTEPTRLRFTGETSFRPRPGHAHAHEPRPKDITGFTLSYSESAPLSAFVAFDTGRLKQIRLPSRSHPHAREPEIVREFEHPPELIKSLTCRGGHLFSYSTGGLLSLYSVSDQLQDREIPLASISSVKRPVNRGYYTYYNESSRIVGVGSSSGSPLLIYSVQPTGISSTPIANLGRGMSQQRRLAVYGITGPPPTFPGGRSDQIIISSWFDGKVRLHDLRDARSYGWTSSAGNMGEHDVPAPLMPCQVLYDPWTTNDAKYSVSAGGPAGACIASGSANHSVICLWDVRQPADGWSVYAPGNDRSPIYSLILDYSRVWCANQSRACVVDFGPDVSLSTYPLLQRTSRSLNPKPGTGGLSYLATYYSHKQQCITENGTA